MVLLELHDGTIQIAPRKEVVLPLEIGAKALHIPTQAVVTIINYKDFKVDVQDPAGKVIKNQTRSVLGLCVGAKCLWSEQFPTNQTATMTKAKVVKINQCTRKIGWSFDIKLLDDTVVTRVSRCALTMLGNAHVMFYPELTERTPAIITPGIMTTVTGVQYTAERGYRFDLQFPDLSSMNVSGVCLAHTAVTRALGCVPV